MFVTPSGERDQPSAESPNKFMQTVLTPAVLEAEKHYYGRTYPSFADAPETDALRDQEIEFIETRDSFYMATITELEAKVS